MANTSSLEGATQPCTTQKGLKARSPFVTGYSHADRGFGSLTGQCALICGRGVEYVVDLEQQLCSQRALRFPLSHFLVVIAIQSWIGELARRCASPHFLTDPLFCSPFQLQLRRNSPEDAGRRNQTSKRERLP